MNGLFRTSVAAGACLILLAASGSQAQQPPVETIARAPQADAPVLWIGDEGHYAGWIGADDAGIHQDVRRIDGEDGPVSVLPLPPTHPYAQSGYAALNDNLHLLWLDAEGDDGNRLFSAVLTPSLAVHRGPTRVSDRLTFRYAAVGDGSGGLWAAWSGGLLAEPSIFVQTVDGDGRPQLPVQVADNGDWPALARSNEGRVFAFWIDLGTRRVMRARVDGGAIGEAAALTNDIRLLPGDRLASVSAALDSDHGYLFWNVTRADGGDESWMTSGPLEGASWEPPQRLALREGETGESRPLSWVRPLEGQPDILPVAAEVGPEIGLVFLWGGRVVRYEPVAALDEPGLIGLPELERGADGRLYVAWSQPRDPRAADLNVAALAVDRPGAPASSADRGAMG